MDSVILSFVATALYLTSGVLLSARLSRGAAGVESSKVGVLSLGLAAVVTHSVLLYRGIFTAQGLNLGVFNASSLITWLIALILILTAYRKPVESLGVILLPIAALAIVLDGLYPSHRLIVETGFWGLSIHILISITAYSLLSLAAVQAVLLAIQDYHLRHKHPGGFIRALPPLQSMEALLFNMIGLGFVFLSAALVTGFAFLENMFAQHLAHKTVLSIVAWAGFATVLWGRHRFGWRGRTAIRWTLSGFFALMLAYFGSKVVLELVLERT